MAARLARVNDPKIKDPSIFQDPTDRQAATLARALRILASPKFKSKTPEIQQAILKDYYNRHVIATYKDLNYPIPDEKHWINGIQDKNAHFSLSDYYDTSANSFITHLRRTDATAIKSAVDLFDHVTVAGIKLDAAASRQFLNVDKFFARFAGLQPINTSEALKYSDAYHDAMAKYVDKKSSQVTDTMGFWLDTHPSKSWTRYIDTTVGELVVQLPFFEALKGPMTVAGASLKAVGEGAKFAPVANLTRTLNVTEGGQYVARRLEDAATAFLSSVVQGQSKKETANNMLDFMVFGAGIEVAGAAISPVLKAGFRNIMAGSSLIKEFTGKVLGMGGTPLQEAITQHAMFEMEHSYVGYDRNSKPVKVVLSDDGSSTSYIFNSHRDSSHTFHATTPEQKTVANEKIVSEVHEHDPVRAKLVSAEKVTLTSIGRDMFDGKNWNQLSKAQRAAVKAKRDALTAQTVAELPYHNQDIAKHAAEVQVAKDAQENTYFAKAVEDFKKQFGEKLKIDIADTVHQAEMDYTAKNTGIDNVKRASITVGKAAETVEEAALKLKSERVKQEPKQYASYKIDSLAYFKNLGKSYSEAKDKAEWEKYLSDMDDDDLIEELKDHAPGLKFEKDKDALLWAYQYKNNFPAPFKQRIEDLLATKVGGNESQWVKEAKNLEAHMENLAYTGQLFSEGNIFRSTDTTGNPTKWQKQHSREYRQQELEEYSAIMQPFLRRHPKEVAQGLRMLKEMQRLRNQAIKDNEPNKVSLLNKRIRSFAADKAIELKAGK